MSKKRQPPDLLTAAAAAAILGVSQRRLQQLAEKKRLDVVPVHARLQLYTRASVERLAAEDRPPGKPPHSQ